MCTFGENKYCLTVFKLSYLTSGWAAQLVKAWS